MPRDCDWTGVSPPDNLWTANATDTYLNVHPQARPLFFELTPSVYQSRVLQVLVEDIRKRENPCTTGFLGKTFAAEVLARAGEHDLL